jgi:hypothetical protein
MAAKSRSTSSAASASKFTTLIAQAREQEAAVLAENQRLKALLEQTDSLIAEQRAALLDVARLSGELVTVEADRSALKSRLASQKSVLLVTASQVAGVSAAVDQLLDGANQPAISAGPAGAAALEAIEKIQAAVFAVTESCLQSESLVVPVAEANALVCTVNDIVEDVVRKGAAVEDTPDTVRRQSYIISALVPQPDE